MSEESAEKKKRINWSPEKVMSISALFVSLITLLALFYQLSLAREENELMRKQQSASVLPYLSLSFSFTPQNFKISFVNKGVGPAFIRKVEFREEGGEKFGRSDFFFNHINEKIYESDSVAIPVSTYSFEAGEVLPANKEIDILTITNRDAMKLFRDRLNSTDWDYTVIYEDVYGARWSLSLENNIPTLISD